MSETNRRLDALEQEVIQMTNFFMEMVDVLKVKEVINLEDIHTIYTKSMTTTKGELS